MDINVPRVIKEKQVQQVSINKSSDWLRVPGENTWLLTPQIFACSYMTLVMLCKPNSFLENPLVFTSFSQIKMAVIQCDFM